MDILIQFGNRIKNDKKLIFFFVLFAFSATLSCLSQPVHDYPLYMKQWENTITLGTPYHNERGVCEGAYGPVHTAFSIFYAVHYNIPKVIFIALWLLCGYLLTCHLSSKQTPTLIILIVVMALFINPYLLKLYIYGQNDLITAALLYIAIYFHKQKKLFWSGIFIGLSFMYKMYAIVVIPFLLFDYTMLISSIRRFIKIVHWQFIVSLFLTLFTGYFTHAILFEDSPLVPFTYFFSRECTSSSIIYFLEEKMSVFWVTRFSLPITLTALIALFFMTLKRKWNYQFSSIVSLYILFLLSPVFFFTYIIGGLLIVVDYIYSYSFHNFSRSNLFMGIYSTLLGAAFITIATLNIKYPSFYVNEYKGIIYFSINATFLLIFFIKCRHPILKPIPDKTIQPNL